MIKKKLPIIFSIIIFLVCIIVLFAGNNIGLSDNGDYIRIIQVNNISYLEDENNSYLFRDTYKMKIEGNGFFEQISNLFKSSEGVEYQTPHHHIIKLSKLLNYINNCITNKSLENYNIFFLAIIYISIFTVGSYYIINAFSNNKYQIISFALILFFFCDAGYILYFNSFYGEALQYATVFLIFGIILQFINNKFSYFKLSALFIAIYYFAGAKLVNIPFAIILSLSTIIFILNKKDIKFRIFTVVFILINIISLIILYVQVPKWMSEATDYQAVFFGILKQSDNVEKDLEKLNLPVEYSALANTHSYMTNYEIDIHSKEFKLGFHDNISKGKIVKYYLFNPIKFISKLSLSIENSCSIRPAYLGNSTDILSYQTNRWSMWSNLRLFTHFLYEPIIVFVLIIGIGIYWLYKIVNKKYKEDFIKKFYLLILIIGIGINLVLPIICNGEADLAKHMFLFTNLIDILFTIILFELIIDLKEICLNKKKLICLITFSLVLITYILLCNYSFSDTIYFGTYNGERIKWDVLYKDSNTIRLISQKSIKQLAFDKNGSNLWEASSIRKWLNSEFLSEFTTDELSLMNSINQDIILSNEYIQLSEKGNHLHYYTYVKNNSDDLINSAYSYEVIDKVSLPTFKDIQNIGKINNKIWLIEPYTNNDYMVRTYEKNGLVLKNSVKKVLDIRPVIEIKNK